MYLYLTTVDSFWLVFWFSLRLLYHFWSNSKEFGLITYSFLMSCLFCVILDIVYTPLGKHACHCHLSFCHSWGEFDKSCITIRLLVSQNIGAGKSSSTSAHKYEKVRRMLSLETESLPDLCKRVYSILVDMGPLFKLGYCFFVCLFEGLCFSIISVCWYIHLFNSNARYRILFVECSGNAI